MTYLPCRSNVQAYPLRPSTIPSIPPTLQAPGYTPLALASRERFLRDAAAAWIRAGDTVTAASMTRAADVQRSRHQRGD